MAVDESTIQCAPVFLGQGVCLFDRIDEERFSFGVMEEVHFPLVTYYDKR